MAAKLSRGFPAPGSSNLNTSKVEDPNSRTVETRQWKRLLGMAAGHHYTPLRSYGDDTRSSEVHAVHDNSTSGASRRTWPIQLFSIIVAVLLGIAAGALVFAFARPQGLPKSDWIICGKSAEEAVAKNCVFDIMMNGWIPPECYVHELSEQYIAQHEEFRFFADRYGYEELSLDDVRKGEHMQLYTTRNHHYAHCAYVWELQGIAIAGGRYIDEHSMNLEHTKHCAGLLLRTHTISDELGVGNGTRVPQIVEIGFMRCRAMW